MKKFFPKRSMSFIRIGTAFITASAILLLPGFGMSQNPLSMSTSVSAASDEYWENLERIRPKAPVGLKYYATDNTITIMWDKVEGASQYQIRVYDQDQKKYVDMTRTPINRFTISAVPGRTYKFVVYAQREITGLVLNGPNSSVITVRTKCSNIYKYPDPADFGFSDLSTATAIRVPNTLAGAFGSEMPYSTKQELEKILDMAEDYKIAMEDKNFTFEESETTEQKDCTMTLCSYKYKGIWAGDLMICIYEDHVLILIAPYDYTDYPGRGEYYV